MAKTVGLVSILALATVVFSLAADFDHTIGEMEHIYHSSKALLLTMYQDRCYFLSVTGKHGDIPLESAFKSHLEHVMRTTILCWDGASHDYEGVHCDHKHNPHHVNFQPSDLHTVRDRFQDLLADFHCLDKNIFTVNVDLQHILDHLGNQHR